MQVAQLRVLPMGCLRGYSEKNFGPGQFDPLPQIELGVEGETGSAVGSRMALLGDRELACVKPLQPLGRAIGDSHGNAVLFFDDTAHERGSRLWSRVPPR